MKMPNTSMSACSSKKWRILSYIIAYRQERGIAPTMREIGNAVGFASTSTVHKYLKAMVSEGLLTAANAKPRSIVPACSPQSNANQSPETHRIRIDMSDGGCLYFDYRGTCPAESILPSICGVFDGTQLKRPVSEVIGVQVVSPDE